jgi:hypothetical protein
VAPLYHFYSYTLLLGLGISHHEPWFDEAQAWLLARDSTPLDLMNRHLRYEGSPGLWHFILSLFAKSGLPYSSLSLVAAAFALTGLILFLCKAPFPLWIKGMFPFSYFVLYQYGIVARSYVLLTPLFFGLAVLYPKRRAHPYSYALLLGLLAHVSLHGLIVAFSLALMEGVNLIRDGRNLSRAQTKTFLLAGAGLFVIGIFAAWQIRFPPDHMAVHPKTVYNPLFALKFTARFLNNAWTEYGPLSSLVFALSLWHFARTRVLALFILPLLLLGHLLAFVYSSPWHEGILFLLWIFCLWISLQKPRELRAKSEPWVLVALASVLIVQMKWAFVAYSNDYRSPYSAAWAVASYLKYEARPRATLYASGFSSIAILPYFDENIFTNYQPRYGGSFWDWSRSNRLEGDPHRLVLDAPDTIVLGIKDRLHNEAPVLPGYASTKFKGSIFWKDRIFEEDSYVVYQKIIWNPEPEYKRRRFNSALLK